MRSFARYLSLSVLLFACAHAQVANQFRNTRKVISINQGSGFGQVYAKGDLNKDGVPDLASVAPTAEPNEGKILVIVSNGSASYDPEARKYTQQHLSTTSLPKILDVNNDGNLDLATFSDIPISDNNEIHVYLGNGDGTLRAPVVSRLSGSNFSKVDYADFNEDGKVDALARGPFQSTSPSGYPAAVHFGNGDGSFAATSIRSAPIDVTEFRAGDWDGDGHQDAVGVLKHDDTDMDGAVELKFMYGDGSGRFGAPVTIVSRREGNLNAIGDFNNDGRTDILGYYTEPDPATGSADSPFAFLIRGMANRTASELRFPRADGYGFSQSPAGDLDLDGDQDLAAHGYSIHYQTTSGFSAAASYYSGTDHRGVSVVDDFNRDGKADILVPVIADLTGNATSFELFINTGSGSSCVVPSGNGINICSPLDNSTVQSPVRLRAAAKLSGAVYRFEVWANGTKIYTGRDIATIDTSVEMAPGMYMMTFVGRTASGERQEKTIKVTVGNGTTCGRPAAAGIAICEPTPFAEVTSPVRVHAWANTGSSPTYRFELWDGATKLATVRDADEMNASVTLSGGTHRLTFVARRLVGTRYTKDVTVTVR